MKMMEIYYAEDDGAIADAVREYLEQRNFKVMVCGTFAGLESRLQSRIPSLVLLDWNMPDGTGREMCRKIRRR